MPGVSATPVASYANVESIRVSHYRSSRCTGIPCAMVLTAYLRAHPGETRLCCLRRLAGCFPRNLAPAAGAPGLHAFTVRERCRTSDDALSSIASRLTFVTTRTSLLSRWDAANIDRSSFLKKRIIFDQAA
jgi:hypothetical protein